MTKKDNEKTDTLPPRGSVPIFGLIGGWFVMAHISIHTNGKHSYG